MPNLTLYGTPMSTYVRTVRLLLAEINADYDLKDVDIFSGENKTDEYLAKQPFGKVPVVAVNGNTIYETVAISDYLNKALAKNKFVPIDLMQEARMRQIIAIVDSYLYPPAVGTIVIQNMIVPQQGGQTDEQAVKKAIAPTQKALGAIEDLCQGSPYLLGQLTLADFHLIPIFVYLEKTPQFEEVTAKAPKLRSWWDQVKNLDSVKAVCA